jgi:predicted regulator of Ras-like GTPase activity (Roadblock/LC7/MglB family)
MRTLLSHLNAVPGVVGSLVCDQEGQLLAHVFPPLFEPPILSSAAALLADCQAGLETVTGKIGLVDLRYAHARVVVRPLTRAHLLFLAAASLNLHLLSISTSVAAPKLEKLIAGRAGLPAAASAPEPVAAAIAPEPLAAASAVAAGRLWQAVQRIDAAIQRKRLDRFKVRGEIALRAGFGLGFIDADTPDDPEMLSKLQAAASAVLGEVTS